jgi:ankyrin repeat protein
MWSIMNDETKIRGEELLLTIKEGDISAIDKVSLEEINAFDLLHAACDESTPNVVELLISKGAPVHAPAKTYMFPIEQAAQRGDIEILRILHENGAPINPIKNLKSGWYEPRSPLLRAIDGNRFEAVKYLLENGADQNVRVHVYVESPLYYAVENNNKSIVQLLLDYKPDFKWLKNKQAISLAAREGHVDILRDLLEASKIRLQSVTGFKSTRGLQSPLEEATSSAKLDCVNLLMDYEANPYACASGWTWQSTPILRSFKIGNLEIIDALLRGNGKFVLDWREINQRYPDAAHIPEEGFLIAVAEASGNQEVIDLAKTIEFTLFSKKK